MTSNANKLILILSVFFTTFSNDISLQNKIHEISSLVLNKPESQYLAADRFKEIKVSQLDKNIIWKVINSPDELTKKLDSSLYTVLIYMAADNDLFPFAGRNIRQMQNIVSNEKLKIVIHFDIQRLDKKKICKRLFIEHNKIIQIGPDATMDSGHKDTLIDFCKWGIEKFPSENYILILWNHGTGIIEPALKKAINPSELFNYNPEKKLIELNRSIGFFDYINLTNNGIRKQSRGICFDDTTNHYITNSDLKEALKIICQNYLGGKKLNLLACDACFMSMIEVVSPLKNYVEYFVASEEVELGTGYEYKHALEVLANSSPSMAEFAKHLVMSFKETYGKITHDYTHSAFDLALIEKLDNNIYHLANILTYGLLHQKNRSIKEAIRLSKHKNFCTYFDEPSYLDFGDLCINLANNASKMNLADPNETLKFQKELNDILKESLESISKIIIANVAGGNLKAARGISIYFPEFHIHSSYQQSEFAYKTNWINFLTTYIKS